MKKRGHSALKASRFNPVPQILLVKFKQNVPVFGRGFVLLPVIVMIALLATVILLLSRENASSLSIARSEASVLQAAYVAEAGLAHATLQLGQNNSCTNYAHLPATPFGLHSYSATVTPDNNSPVTLSAVGNLADGSSQTLTRTNVKAFQPSTSLVLQPDSVAGKDTYIYEWQSARNFGADVNLRVENRYASSWSNALLEFDLSAIPASATVLSASLSLHQNAAAAAGGDFSVHRVTSTWEEGSMNGTNGSPNWTERKTSDAWTAPGGDFDPTAMTSISIPPGIGVYQWDIRHLAQDWISGKFANRGLAIVPASYGSNAFFSSSDSTNAANRPKLSITYACECGKPCGSVTESDELLLVVGNAAIPAMQDTAKKALTESWGYVVSLIDDNASQAEFDTAVAGSKVAYVSATVLATTLNTKLADATIGVLNESPGLVDEFGFSSDRSGANRTDINVDDNSHYITSPFPLGQRTIHTAAQPTSMLIGTLATDLEPLANADNGGWIPTLAALEKGATRHDGVPAAGRRVKLPWGGAAFDHALMNADGETIMRRAIEWAATPPSPNSINVLFVVGSVGGPGMTTEEIAHQTLIESWGHSVDIIDDGDSQAAFDAAIANNDVVFLTNDVTASSVGTKLVGATIGVVTSEVNLSDELGIASTVGWDSGTEIEINDNTHFITSAFSPELLTILSANESLAYVSGTVSPDLDSLASSSSGYGIVALEAGAAMFGGGAAAGRRVQLPWGGNGFDPNNLNADGLGILRRAIEWGAGTGSISTFETRISDGNDDSEQRTGDGYVDVSSSDLELSFDIDGSNTNLVGMRFTGIAVPQGATITNAYIQFQVDELKSGSSSLVISGQNIDNAAPFTSADFDISDRATTSASIPWVIPTWSTVGEAGPDQRTPDIASIVQEIVGRAGWSIGNSLVVMITGSGTRTAEAFEGDPGGAPLLHIEFEGSGGGGSSDPVAHWKLDESSGTIAADSVGNNDGTLVNGPIWVAGKIDGGLSFDGSNDYIDVSSLNPKLYNDFTVSAWYRSADSDVSDDEYIFEHNENFVNEVTFGPTDDGTGDRLRFGFAHGGSGTWDPHYGTSDIVDQQWHHVVGVRSGGRIKLYVDGLEETDEPDAHAGLTIAIDGDGPFIGDLPGNTEQVHGTVDDVRLYDRALSAAEILDLYDAGGGGIAPPGVFGFDTAFDSTQSNVRRLQVATQVTLPEDGTITSITAYVGGRDRIVRYAIYSDAAGEPGALQVESANILTQIGMSWISADVPATTLTAGTYWLALSFDDNLQQYAYQNGGQARYSNNRATQSGFTASWGTSTASFARNISIYATYTPQ